MYTTTASAYQIEIGGCYSINGPANVRNVPNGKIVNSLKNKEKVRVIDIHNDKWYLIEYVSNKSVVNCQFNDAPKKVWIHFGNLLPIAKSINYLISRNKVMYAHPVKDLNGNKSISFLGSDYEILCNSNSDEPCHLKIPKPFEITIYCLNGSGQRNRISKVEFDYGGDQNAWLSNIKFDKKIPSEGCIIVDGSLDSG